MFYQLSCKRANLGCWLQSLLSPCFGDHGLTNSLNIDRIWRLGHNLRCIQIRSSMIKRAHVEVCCHIRGRAQPTCPLCSSTRGSCNSTDRYLKSSVVRDLQNTRKRGDCEQSVERSRVQSQELKSTHHDATSRCQAISHTAMQS